MTKDELKETIWHLKDSLIDDRNEILDSIWSYLNPCRKRNLRRIELIIDQLDLILYRLEKNENK